MEEKTCMDKSRSARRRRMEIRQFKLLANGSCNNNNKRLRLCRNQPDTATTNAVVEEEKELPSVDGDRCPPYGVVSICGRREEMEDALRVVPALASGSHDRVYHFFAVYDGHGGSQAAFHCKNRIHESLAEEIRGTDPQTETEWKAAMKSVFLKTDVEVVALLGKGQEMESRLDEREHVDAAEKPGALDTVGSTAVVAVVGARHIVVANCGDSRAVLSRAGIAIPLSTDHKPELPEEMERIEAAGGKVIYWNGYRVFGVLAMSRAIGDKYFKPCVIAEPEVSFTERSEEDECLIVASDGLWDVVSNQVACDIAKKCLALRRGSEVQPAAEPAARAAALLKEVALAWGSADNISVIVVDLRRRSLPN